MQVFMEQDKKKEDRLQCMLCFLRRALMASSIKYFDMLVSNVKNVEAVNLTYMQ